MRMYTRACVVAGLFVLMGDAAADLVPEGKKILIPSVTFTAPAQSLLVAYPIDCFEGLGRLNPHLGFAHDYDVLEPGVPREAYKFCEARAQLYAFDAAAFPKNEERNPEPAWRRSKWNLAALDEIPVDKRAAFFA